MPIFVQQVNSPDTYGNDEGENPGKRILVNYPEPLSHERGDVKQNHYITNFQFAWKRFQLLREQRAKGF